MDHIYTVKETSSQSPPQIEIRRLKEGTESDIGLFGTVPSLLLLLINRIKSDGNVLEMICVHRPVKKVKNVFQHVTVHYSL